MSSSHLCSTAVGGLRSGAIGRRVTRRASSAVATQGLRLCVCMARGTEEDESVNRRRTLLSLPALALAIRVAGAATAEVLEQEPVEDTAPQVSSSRKVVVLGGNGFVGSRVCKLLVQAGCDVVSVSRSGLPPSWAAGKEDWVSRVTWTKGDVLSDDISFTLKGSSAVISCIGVIGGTYDVMEKGNGSVNAAAVEKSRAAGVPKFVYVSVASIVPDSVSGIVGSTDFKGYFDGKKEAETAIAAAYPGSAVIVKPSFIYGGSEFGLAPPRVAAGYGSAIEALLSASPIHALAKVMPGPIALTLEPPVSVENVAAAAVGGAVGALPPGAIDGTASINEAADSFMKTLAG